MQQNQELQKQIDLLWE